MEKDGVRFWPCSKCAGIVCFNGPPFPDVSAYLHVNSRIIGSFFPLCLITFVRKKY